MTATPGSSLTLDELLGALGRCWAYANETDGTADNLRFVRPEYRRALEEAWLDVVLAVERRDTEQRDCQGVLNVDMARRRHKKEGG